MTTRVRSLRGLSRRSKLLSAAASAAAIALVAVILPAGAASGQLASTSTLPDAGVLRLRLGAEDHLRFEPPTGPAVTQSVSTAGGCKLSLSPAANLVTFSAPAHATHYPGFFDDGIGVGSKAEGNGQPCGRIDPGQILTMNLAQGAGAALEGKYIDYAELDIEGKFGVTLKVDGYFGTTLLKSETYATTGPDSGPDSADGDNFRIRFPKTGKTVVNRLVFSIVGSTGAASLEGGADGTGACDGSDANSAGCADFSLGNTIDDTPTLDTSTTDSLFHLTEVDTFLDCGGTATQGGDGTPSNSLERLDNASGECTPIPINLDSEVVGIEQFITLQKDLLGQSAQFFWTVTWVPESGAYQENETQFDFGDGYQDLQLCLGDSDGDGFPNLPPTADTEDPEDAVDPWCVIDTSTELQVGGPNDGLVIVTEKYFGSGDPGGKR